MADSERTSERTSERPEAGGVASALNRTDRSVVPRYPSRLALLRMFASASPHGFCRHDHDAFRFFAAPFAAAIFGWLACCAGCSAGVSSTLAVFFFPLLT